MKTEATSSHKTKSHLSLKVPVKEPLPCSPNVVPMERDVPSAELMFYSFIYISESSVKELSHKIGRKRMVTFQGAPRGR